MVQTTQYRVKSGTVTQTIVQPTAAPRNHAAQAENPHRDPQAPKQVKPPGTHRPQSQQTSTDFNRHPQLARLSPHQREVYRSLYLCVDGADRDTFGGTEKGIRKKSQKGKREEKEEITHYCGGFVRSTSNKYIFPSSDRNGTLP